MNYKKFKSFETTLLFPGLLDDIRDDPDNDELRLDYAEALEDGGAGQDDSPAGEALRAQADFIRNQVKLQALQDECGYECEIEEYDYTAKDVVEKDNWYHSNPANLTPPAWKPDHWAKTDGLASCSVGVYWNRGFPSKLTTTCDVWKEKGREIMLDYPTVGHVYLGDLQMFTTSINRRKVYAWRNYGTTTKKRVLPTHHMIHRVLGTCCPEHVDSFARNTRTGTLEISFNDEEWAIDEMAIAVASIASDRCL